MGTKNSISVIYGLINTLLLKYDRIGSKKGIGQSLPQQQRKLIVIQIWLNFGTKNKKRELFELEVFFVYSCLQVFTVTYYYIFTVTRSC
jgi:hypothetical protein